jgi:membrane-associated phospholipid phosphatase
MFLKKSYFFYGLLLYLIFGAILLLSISKGDEIWWLNSLHSPPLDFFMKYLTHLGDGIFAAFVVFCLLWWRYEYAFAALLALLTSSFFTQFLKKIIFPDVARPLAYLQDHIALHLVEGVTVHRHFSFPSGHATTAFMLFSFFSLLAKDKRWGILFLLLAILTSLTRPYLLQHFFVDIYVGSIIGTSFSFLFWYLFGNEQLANKNKVWKKSLRDFF